MAKSVNLLQLGDFVLNSGARSSWKLECDALTPADWLGAAEMIHQLVPPFGSVWGVPSGGVRLADALRPYGEFGAPPLIVDDVLTTGGSMERYKAELAGCLTWKEDAMMGAVLFARGPCPEWVQAVFQLPRKLWVAKP